MSSTAVETLASTLSSTQLRGSDSPPLPASTNPSGLIREPLIPSGILDGYLKELTPVIGSEVKEIELADLLKEGNEEKLRELAIVVSRRNVVFFRNQSRKLTDVEIKALANKLGEYAGRPAESGLHLHPTENSYNAQGEGPDPEGTLSPITTQFTQPRRPGTSLFASKGWHSDITFEPHPSDFAILQMWQIPENGGDTIWASGYEAYDRLTPAMQQFLEGLTAVNDGNGFHQRAKLLGRPIHEGPRGHPENVGSDLSTVHPVIRTNPVTGWKSLFVNNAFTKSIVELNKDESDLLLSHLFRIVDQNHDLQVRYKWETNDVAIWNNSSSFHTVTVDYEGLNVRNGNRTVSLGERPYIDPKSKGRREALGLPKFAEW